MNVSQWHMHRLGLVDFWCYDNDEFYFNQGHMLLRGSNGSGKSVTMQSMIPLLLDGNRSSERLDPFGSRARTLDTYLIDENTDRDERIGYLYLEFKRAQSDLYLTIGMGIRARRNKHLETWYFVVEDNRRVGIDFTLMEHHLTLTKKQLVNVLGNQVIDSQRDYMRKVNDVLFGFENVEDYKDAIDLLLQLRSPKLSNSLSPSKINELLAHSLQPLSEDDLRPMSEAITNMDNLQDELENMKVSLNAAKRIWQSYDTYNRAMLMDKWLKKERESKLLADLTAQGKAKQEEIRKMSEERQLYAQEARDNQVRLEVLTHEKELLSSPEVEKMASDLESTEKQLSQLTITLGAKQSQRENKDLRRLDVEKQLDHYQQELDCQEKEAREAFEELEAISTEFPFTEHAALRTQKDHLENYAFDYTRRRLKEEERQTRQLAIHYQRYEQMQQQLSMMEEQLLRLDVRMQEAGVQLEKYKHDYRTCIQYYQETFHQYAQTCQEMVLDADTLAQMTALLIDYEKHQDYHQISDLVYVCYLSQNEMLLHAFNELEIAYEKARLEYDQLYLEYQRWEKMQDYEPERDPLVVKQRHYLDRQGIRYIPFYQLIDFANTGSTLCDVQEELLNQLNLLDALVVEEKDRARLEGLMGEGHDYYLWTQKPLDTLQTVLLPETMDAVSLAEVLRELGIREEMAFFQCQEKSFTWGALAGTLDGSQTSRLIGIQRRQEYRKQQLDSLKEQLKRGQEGLTELEQKKKNLTERRNQLKQEQQDFIDDSELKKQYRRLAHQIEESTLLQQQLDHLMDEKLEWLKQVHQVYEQIKQQAALLLVEPSKEAIDHRIEDIAFYEDYLDQLRQAIVKLASVGRLKAIAQEKHDELIDDLDALAAEVDQLTSQQDVLTGRREMILQEMEASGFQELQQKLQKISDDIRHCEQLVQQALIQHSRLDAQLENAETLYEQISQNCQAQKRRCQLYQNLFDQELEYALVDDPQSLLKNQRAATLTRSVTDYLGSLQTVFFEQVAYLSSYHLTYEVDPLSQNVEDLSGHFLIYAHFQGRKMPFSELLAILDQRIESQQLLIQDEDRLIFEEILVNTIGKKIRQRIQASQRWVEKMSRYMHDMNISSGLELSLRWRPIQADVDEQLDTAELVQLLEKDYRILKDTDRQKISKHFRSKIAECRRLSLDEHTTASFHQLIREVMDYRQWFVFTLYAKKTNESRRELTNRVFYAYSGGEKAIAMYVPLFSAVAAKFSSARADAPLLIALDEAFAGVDSNNIDNMFALVTKFGFDYIMNSQALWGDYPSCQVLAIYELIRPNNAPYVTKIAYEWNGHVRKLVTS